MKIKCKRGHKLSGANLYLRKNGSRECRKCSIKRAIEHYQSKKAVA